MAESRVEHRGPFPSATAAEHLVNTWQAAVARTEAMGTLRRVLYAAVAAAADANGSASYDHRVRLTRTEMVAAVTAAAELVDVDALEAAVRDGRCSALRYEHDPAPSDSFYEGTATRPVHVASGLVVPRPDLASRVVAAIDAGRPVLLVGPSGVPVHRALSTLTRMGPTLVRAERVYHICVCRPGWR